MPTWWMFIVTGLVAGVASGMFGIGGGIIIIPVLVLIFKMDQQSASGTSLVALLLPVGAFAVWNYWQAGKIGPDHLTAGLWLGFGILIGAIFGSKLAIGLSSETLRKLFAGFMVVAAARMSFG
jgi:uncharacterized membrane protein YfcA